MGISCWAGVRMVDGLRVNFMSCAFPIHRRGVLVFRLWILGFVPMLGIRCYVVSILDGLDLPRGQGGGFALALMLFVRPHVQFRCCFGCAGLHRREICSARQSWETSIGPCRGLWLWFYPTLLRHSFILPRGPLLLSFCLHLLLCVGFYPTVTRHSSVYSPLLSCL